MTGRGASAPPGRQRGIGFSYIHIVRIFLHTQTGRRGVNNVIIEVGGGILDDLSWVGGYSEIKVLIPWRYPDF